MEIIDDSIQDPTRKDFQNRIHSKSKRVRTDPINWSRPPHSFTAEASPAWPGRFLPRRGTSEDESILSGCEPWACGKLSSRDVPRCPDGTFIPSWTIGHPESGGDGLTCPWVACGPDLEREDGGLD